MSYPGTSTLATQITFTLVTTPSTNYPTFVEDSYETIIAQNRELRAELAEKEFRIRDLQRQVRELEVRLPEKNVSSLLNLLL